ncbi:ABC transporter permease [Candidatus Peregrinibacteria bacterium]|nr:ABC transporter permease [Candidatus Peregrinibacteria bacterium]
MVARTSLISLHTIVRREVVRFLRIWTQTLLPPVITQSLYFLIFGAFIGSQVRAVNGIPYMAFLVPGLVMMAVISSSFANVVGSFFGAKFQRNHEEWMVSPTPDWVIVAGYVFGGVLRGLLVGLIVLVICAIFVPLQIHNFFAIILFILLTALVFSLAGLVNAVFATKFDDISLIPTFVLTPLTYLGGVFYSIKDLPPLMQTISQFNPILYMVDGFRYGFYGFSDVSIWMSIAVLLGFTFTFILVSLYLLKKGIGLRT